MENMRKYNEKRPYYKPAVARANYSSKLYFRYSPFRIGRVTLNFTAKIRTTNTVLPPIICAM